MKIVLLPLIACGETLLVKVPLQTVAQADFVTATAAV